MVSKQAKEDLAIQLILLGITLVVFSILMVPKWKLELWWRAFLIQLLKWDRASQQTVPALSESQERDLLEFRRKVSRYSHEGP